MKRILTGVQCSGNLHLGNIVSTIIPTVQLTKGNNEIFVFIANLHTFTSIKDPLKINTNLYDSAAKWISLGLDTNKTTFYRQSMINGICELTWILNCLTPFRILANAHAFKEKSTNLKEVNIGLFDYPILMASDILLFQPDLVVVGKDQKQHIEITRNIATIFNNTFDNIFKMPKELILENLELIPGTDGRKMSKSYNNTIDIFNDEKQLLQSIMSIKTDSKKPEEPKDPDKCIIFNIYKTIAKPEDTEKLKNKYLHETLMYKDAKMLLFETILNKFKEERYIFNKIKNDKTMIDNIFKKGEIKAQEIANETLKKIKTSLKLI